MDTEQAKEVKRFLMQYKNALVDIRNTEATIEELETMAESITVSTDRERVQSSGSLDKVGDVVARICDMKTKLICRKAAALEKVEEVETVINRVENENYRQLLHRRYIEQNSWEQIEEAMHFTYRHITRLHGIALGEVDKIIKCH